MSCVSRLCVRVSDRERHGRAFFFFFNDTATTEIYTLSLHDALPIWRAAWGLLPESVAVQVAVAEAATAAAALGPRSEEHTSELQSQSNLVCRLLLEKKKISTVDYLQAR